MIPTTISQIKHHFEIAYEISWKILVLRQLGFAILAALKSDILNSVGNYTFKTIQFNLISK